MARSTTTLPSGDAFDRVRDAKYVLLTTFKRDGSAVPTAVWAVPLGTPDSRALRIWTQRRTGKVKRVRAGSRAGAGARVQIAPCTRTGKPTGETVEAVASLLGSVGTLETIEGLRTRYGFMARLLTRRAQKRPDDSIGIEVTLPSAPDESTPSP